MSSNSSGARQQQIPTLSKGSSYEFWSTKMKTLLKSEGLWEFVETHSISDQKDFEKQDAKALFFIQQALDESVFSIIATATSAKKAWSLLKDVYQRSNMELKPKSREEIMDFILDQSVDLKDVSKENRPSIYTIPRTHRDLNASSFNPRVVSIGPLHREDEDLQANEGEKAAHVLSLKSRLVDSLQEEAMQACVKMANASIDKIRSCYSETINYTNSELAKMMVIDGCFILEYLYRLKEEKKTKFGNSLFFELAFYDLLMLENQIPFFVLEYIFRYTINVFDQSTSLNDIIHNFIEQANPFKEHKFKSNSNIKSHHILGIMQQYYHDQNGKSEDLPDITLQSAAELDRAGVKFKPVKDTDWPLAMEVKSRRLPNSTLSWGNPTLIMPVLTIDDFTLVVLRNLIAYEQFDGVVDQYVTSYTMIMDMLVNTEEDIAKMVESKVLRNLTSSNQEAADMINKLCKEVFGRDCFYVKQMCELDLHYTGSWGRNVAWLNRTYFDNPWNVIALLAGIILFVLTVVQTAYTIEPADQSEPKIGKIGK